MSGSIVDLIKEITETAGLYFKYSKIMEARFRQATSDFGDKDLTDTSWWEPRKRSEAYSRVEGLRIAISELAKEFEECNLGYCRKIYEITSTHESGIRSFVLKKINEKVVEDVNQFILMFALYNKLLDKTTEYHDYLSSVSDHHLKIEGEHAFDSESIFDALEKLLIDMSEIQEQLINVSKLGEARLTQRIIELGNNPYSNY